MSLAYDVCEKSGSTFLIEPIEHTDSNGKNSNYRHPIQGSFTIEFAAICNHCGVMGTNGGLKSQDVEIFLRPPR